jgi:hypothetical protein
MRRPVALVVLTLAFCACRGEPPGPQSAGSQRAREQALQQNEQARRLAQTQQNDAGEVAGNTTDAPEGPGYLTPGPAPSQIPPTTRPGAAGAALPKGEGSAAGTVVRATDQQVVVRTPAGQVLPLMVDDGSRIRSGGSELKAGGLSPGTEVRATWSAHEGALQLKTLEVR